MEQTQLGTVDMEAFAKDAKIGILATVSPEGLPHVSLITTLTGKGPSRLIWGQFCEGRSKANVTRNPKVGFAVVSLDRQIWSGKALWTHDAHEGDDYDFFNRKPLFRYNTYFGIHRVHTMDLVSVSAGRPLPMPRLLAGYGLCAPTALAAWRPGQTILKPWAVSLFNRPENLKFFSWVGPDGHPVVVPAVPCLAAGSRRLVFATSVDPGAWSTLRKDTEIAVFAMSMSMESVMVRGWVRGPRGLGPARVGVLDIEMVYNSMPPLPGQVYPVLPLKAVEDFG